MFLLSTECLVVLYAKFIKQYKRKYLPRQCHRQWGLVLHKSFLFDSLINSWIYPCLLSTTLAWVSFYHTNCEFPVSPLVPEIIILECLAFGLFFVYSPFLGLTSSLIALSTINMLASPKCVFCVCVSCQPRPLFQIQDIYPTDGSKSPLGYLIACQIQNVFLKPNSGFSSLNMLHL